MSARTSKAATVAKNLTAQLKTLRATRLSAKDPRIHITSPSLCQDALQRLAPSLKAHHGCDLIDINPGPCLWSQHLHETIKPRRHILVEPDRRQFDAFVKPLIDQNPERYYHADSLLQVLDAEAGLLSPAVINNGISSPSTTENPSLLINANLSGIAKSTGFKGLAAGSFVGDYCYSFTSGIRSDIHRYGLVRLLAWVPDAYRPELMPRTVKERSRQSMYLEACSSISEIASAGWSRDADPFKRELIWPDLYEAYATEVRAAEAAAGLKTSDWRRPLPPLQNPQSLSLDLDMIRSTPLMLDPSHRIQKLLALDEAAKEDNLAWRDKAVQQALNSKQLPRAGKGNSVQRDFRKALIIHSYENDLFNRVVANVKSQLELDHQWRREKTDDMDPALLQDLRKQAQECGEILEQSRNDFKTLGKQAIDDYRAFYAEPRAMAWNQRSFEPLLVHEDEFEPNIPLSLLDFRPKPHFRQIFPRQDQPLLFSQILGVLCRDFLSMDLHKALDLLLGGAGVDEFVETVPSLGDPTKGGYFDMKQLRVRSLPVETLMDIALAYDEWPFKPETEIMFDTEQDKMFAN
jgi:mitochondrial transcription factor 1